MLIYWCSSLRLIVNFEGSVCSNQWRIQDCPQGGFVFLPQKSDDLLGVTLTLQMHISVLNSTPPNLSLLPQPPFSCHPRRFTSPNSAPPYNNCFKKFSFCLRGRFVRTQRPLDPPQDTYHIHGHITPKNWIQYNLYVHPATFCGAKRMAHRYRITTLTPI